MAQEILAVLGVGMTSSIGHDARTSCASFRAGITRAAPLPYHEEHSEEEDEPVPVTGHPAAVPTLNAEGMGKMVVLGAAALKDLLHQPTRSAAPGSRLGLYLAVPNYSLREETFIDFNKPGTLTNPSTASDDDEDDETPYSVEFARQCNQSLWARVQRLAGTQLPPPTVERVVHADQCGFALALHAAANDLVAGHVERCIVGAIDSMLDPDSLAWAAEQRRLKFEGQPCGYSPGEGAVFVELSTSAHAAQAGLDVQARLSRPSFSRDRLHDIAETGPQGVALSAAVAKALSGVETERLGLVIGALNGEVDRSQDWGYALNRLLPLHRSLSAVRAWYPAAGFGETGCAGAGFAICLGLHAMQRNYAGTDHILIWSTGDTGTRAAMILSRSV